MDLQFVNKEACVYITKSVIWQYKYASDCAYIKRKLQKKLASDILSLYENSQFVDLKLVAPEGHLYSHKHIIAGRYPSFWQLLSEIGRIQFSKVSNREVNVLTVSLPQVNYCALEGFIRSLYTSKIDESAAVTLIAHLEDQLVTLQRKTSLRDHKLYLEKLDFEEEIRVQEILLTQIRTGRISEQKGNLRDVTHLIPPRDVTHLISPNFKHWNQIPKAPTPCKSNADLLSEGSQSSRLVVCAKKALLKGSKCSNSNQDFCTITMSSEESEKSDSKVAEPLLSGKCLNSLAFNDKGTVKEAIHTEEESATPSLSVACHVENIANASTIVKKNSTRSESHFSKESDSTYLFAGASNDSKSKYNLSITTNGVSEPEAMKFSSVKAKVKKLEKFATRRISSDSLLPGNARQFQLQRSQSERKASAIEEAKQFYGQNKPDEECCFSDSDQTGINETSSLEVELPSSHEDESFSGDSGKSDENYIGKCVADSELNSNSQCPGQKEPPVSVVNPHKPLVRTRTFDLIEPTCDAVHIEEQQPANRSETEIIKNSQNNVEKKTVNSVDLPKTSSTIQQLANVFNKEENPVKLRELERKKGSMLFEHNFQTFSNIPTTNMMTSGMMNVSMSSESSMGLGSLYSSMIDSAMISSIHSLGNNNNDTHSLDPLIGASTIQPSYAISSANVLENIPLSTIDTMHKSLSPKTSQEELAIDIHHAIAKQNSDTRSPSPDSLSIDLALSDAIIVSKEDLNIEEKEKDDEESMSKNKLVSQDNNDDKNVISDSNSINSFNSPRTLRRTENMPIVSGGSTLRRESRKSSKDESHHLETQRQNSCGLPKDIDSIPLVCGYVSPDRDKENLLQNSKVNKNSETMEDENKQNQSMFSMFINFNEIPSPKKEVAPEISKAKAQPSGGMYMFIEAETSSPKSKRRSRTECEQNKPQTDSHTNNKTGKLDENPEKQQPLANTIEEICPPAKIPMNENENKSESSEKKGFFVFIEADNLSKGESPKLKRRPIVHRPTKGESVMSKSAPSDSHIFNKEDSSMKIMTSETSRGFMTKSVIDREEFMAQPPTRRNVSLNDKINESSKIPRPVINFKEKLSASKKEVEHFHHQHKKVHSLYKKKVKNAELSEAIKTLEGSLSGTASLSVSFSDAMSNSVTHDIENASDVSDVSSLLSSIERSNEPSDQEGKGTQNALGDDLLKMFLNEINTDVTIQIGEKRIRAHKCILASRCVYFAAMLSGHWVESAGNVIKLQGFSPEAVMEALRHIYSGSSTVPEGVKVGELAALADMLALDGLKDVVALHLKANMCHYFHKPCPECLTGVLEVLPIAGAYCLDELYHKCLKWIAKNFIIVLPTRNFASLPSELQDRCLKQIMDDMSVSNVIDNALGGERVLSLLPVVRWAQPVFDLTAQLLESATNFIAANFSGVLASDRYLDLGRDGGWNVDSLEETLKLACELIRPDQAVLSHIQLTKLIECRQDDLVNEFSDTFLNMCERLLNQVEKFIIHNANRVAVCRKWPMLPPETQKRMKDAALVIVEFSKPIAPKPKFSSAARVSRGNKIEPNIRARASSMSDHRLSRSASANVVPPVKVGNTRRLQPSLGRCHTPPPALLRASLQTPPPTRASTLRAQARQSAIQRSQSARTVSERPKRLKSTVNDLSVENESSPNTNSIFARGATFTRSLSRTEPVQGRSRTSSQGSFQAAVSSSRSSTPGLPDRACHKRVSSGPQISNRTMNNEIVFQRTSGPICGRPLSVSGEPSNTKFLRTYSVDVHSKPTRSSSMGASPHHLCDGKENVVHLTTPARHLPLKEQKKHIDSTNGNLPRPPPTVVTRLRSPINETCNAVSPSKPHHSSECMDISSNVISDDRAPDRESNNVVIGLGGRSNTFCKDEQPAVDVNLVKAND